MADAEQPSFQIEKVYVKDLSLEIPGAPQVFLEAQQPQLEIQVKNESSRFGEALFEVTITVTVTAKAAPPIPVPAKTEAVTTAGETAR